MPLIASAAAILVLGLVVFVLNSQSGGDDGGETTAPPEQRQPAAPSRSAPKATQLKMGTATAGKTPDRPAPTLTNEMLQKANAMIDEAKELFELEAHAAHAAVLRNREGKVLHKRGRELCDALATPPAKIHKAFKSPPEVAMAKTAN